MNYNELIKNEKLKLKENRFFFFDGRKYWGYQFKDNSTIEKETEKALLISFECDKNIIKKWIPKAILENVDDLKKQKLEKYQKLVDFATKNGIEIPKYTKSKDIYKMLEERGLKYE